MVAFPMGPRKANIGALTRDAKRKRVARQRLTATDGDNFAPEGEENQGREHRSVGSPVMQSIASEACGGVLVRRISPSLVW